MEDNYDVSPASYYIGKITKRECVEREDKWYYFDDNTSVLPSDFPLEKTTRDKHDYKDDEEVYNCRRFGKTT